MEIKIIGKRIREVRQRKKLSQSDLARESGVSRSQIARVETGRGMLSVPHIRAIARALGTSVDYLIGTFEDIESKAAVAGAMEG